MIILCPNGHENSETNRFCQACGSQIVAPGNQLTTGLLLGDRYRVKAEIGQGGFGRTYLCEDINRFNELCVLKEFAPQVQGTALLTKAQELFEREAGVMYRLQHPQIPMFREMFRVNSSGVGQLFLVQDFVDGVSYQGLLKQKIKDGKKFTEAEITKFLKQILPVLGYIHSLGVIHRDISPDNLIERHKDGLPVLIDFGGVKQVAVNAVNAVNETNPPPAGGNLNSDVPTRLGKVGYAPNEQMQRGVVFPHSDLYALAATSLVLLTGKEPPELIDPQNFTWNWREYIDLSPNLASILDRMLQLRPNNRFESAADVLKALETGSVNSPAVNLVAPVNLVVPPTFVAPVGNTPPTTKTASNSSSANSQAATVVAGGSKAPPTAVSPISPTPAKTPGLLGILSKTWLTIAAVVGAVACGWAVASILSKKPQSSPTRSESTSPPSATTPSPVATDTASSPTPVATSTPIPSLAPITTANSTTTTPLASISPTLPADLASKGANDRAYGDAVKQVYTSQNPNIKTVPAGDNTVKTQLDAIAADLGTKLTNKLDREAISGIGTYHPANRATWRSQVNRLKLSERTLIDLTDAKYRTITDVTAQKLGISNEQFLKTPLGQIYMATMSDRVRALQAKQATDEIVFPTGETSGKVSGTLQPGEGKAYIASLGSGQKIAVDINTADRTQLSIYPPTSKLPAMLTASDTKKWSGKTSANGYHEFIIVSQSDRPINYELQLSADTLW
jgi:serine/threonine protein kinase, bacterial